MPLFRPQLRWNLEWVAPTGNGGPKGRRPICSNSPVLVYAPRAVSASGGSWLINIALQAVEAANANNARAKNSFSKGTLLFESKHRFRYPVRHCGSARSRQPPPIGRFPDLPLYGNQWRCCWAWIAAEFGKPRARPMAHRRAVCVLSHMAAGFWIA